MKELMNKEDAKVLLLFLLGRFEEVCEKANIPYYASGGTLLGAVRHGGFIPWDDDIDVMIERKYYSLFVRTCKEVLEEPVVFESRENDPDFCQEYIKLCFKEDDGGFSALSLDVFFLDNTDRKQVVLRAAQNLTLQTLYSVKKMKLSNGAYTPKNPLKKAAVSFLSKKLSFGDIELLHKKTMLKEERDTGLLVNWGSCYSYKKATYRKIDLGTPQRLPFENTTVSAAEHPEAILKKLYGEDYMTLPPEEKRTDHGVEQLHCSALDFDEIKRKVGLEK